MAELLLTPTLLIKNRPSSITSPKAIRSFNKLLLFNKVKNEDDESLLHEKLNVCSIPWCNCSKFRYFKDAILMDQKDESSISIHKTDEEGDKIVDNSIISGGGWRRHLC